MSSITKAETKVTAYTLALMLSFLILSGSAAQAQQPEQPAVKPRIYREPYFLPPSTESDLTIAQRLIEERKFDQAEILLAAQLRKPEIDAYEKALIWQTMAYLHSEQENYAAAIDDFRMSIAVSDTKTEARMPQAEILATMYNIGQLYMVVERYTDAARQIEDWIDAGGDGNASALSLLATAYYQAGDYPKALHNIRLAIAKGQPESREVWYQLELSIDIASEDWTAASALLEDMTDRWPENCRYQTILAAVYDELGRNIDSSATINHAVQLDCPRPTTLNPRTLDIR